ncbi:nitroreductase family protein [Clostridium paraputrificum]|uniref:nitroreductase family protein n=1 Tax=Clostridium TaxID=1485 RepID=UPI003D3489FC
MSFFDLVNRRQSVRSYSEAKVEREIIEKIIGGARVAPSACNSQPWKFIIVDDSEVKEELVKSIYDPLIGMNKFALTAPVFIVVVAEKRNLVSGVGAKIKGMDYTSLDIGIACEHICLGATELGLGTCMIGWFKEKGVKDTLSIPRNREVKLIISLGYGQSDEVRGKIRKEQKEIISYNNY